MTDIKKLNYELSSISRYAGLLYSKYTLLILLAIIYYPMRITPAYIFIAAILTPVVPRIVSASQQPAKDQKDNFTLRIYSRQIPFTTETINTKNLAVLLHLSCFCCGISKYTTTAHTAFLLD